jgi:cyanophycinase
LVLVARQPMLVHATEAGFVLAGGGKDVEEAMKWMIERSGGGDFVILRASGFYRLQ